jgi:hypothetical protein
MDDWLISKPTIEKTCTLGDKNSTKTIALIGDSHAQHWIKALEPFANKHSFKIVTYIKSACSFTDIDIYEELFLKRLYPECNSWRKEAINQITNLKPDTIIWSEALYSNSDPEKYESMINKLSSISNRVIKIIDTPRATTFVPECLTKNDKDIKKCNYKKYEGVYNPSQVDKENEINKKLNTKTIQTLDWFCYIDECPVVIDNIIAFRDPHHITTTYSKYLSEPMEKRLLQYFPELTK